jgi:hypothetical protein
LSDRDGAICAILNIEIVATLFNLIQGSYAHTGRNNDKNSLMPNITFYEIKRFIMPVKRSVTFHVSIMMFPFNCLTLQ